VSDVVHEPQVRKIAWECVATMSFDALAGECRRRAELDDTAWERLLWHGGLYVGGRRIDAAAPPLAVEAGSAVAAYVFLEEPRLVCVEPSAILYDAGGMVVVDKPAHLPVQGTRASQRISLETELRRLLDCPTLTPVHRLDRETSGLNVFARDGRTAAPLCAQFFARTVEKRYVAAVAPEPAESAWRVQGWLAQVPHPRHARYALFEAERPDARPSDTSFSVVARRDGTALVEARPLTGRTHQIRVHLAAGGTPIIGDHLYGATDNAPRVMLHAAGLRLRDPAGAACDFESPLPEGFAV
jgi:23S rRNA pseudouridine1911/1915/1917 synthase